VEFFIKIKSIHRNSVMPRQSVLNKAASALNFVNLFISEVKFTHQFTQDFKTTFAPKIIAGSQIKPIISQVGRCGIRKVDCVTHKPSAMSWNQIKNGIFKQTIVQSHFALI
jgi:hypothetical protein